MTIRELYDLNIELQYICDSLVKAVHVQNYDRALRNFIQATKMLSRFIDGCIGLKDIIGIDITECGINDFLSAIMGAQQANDYILMADLIDMQLKPFLLDVSDSMRSSCDIIFCQEIWDENIKHLHEKNSELALLLEAEQKKWLKADDAKYCLEATNSGLFTLCSADNDGNYYLHSNVNPQVEAREFADYHYGAGCDSYILFGLGLGYHCKELVTIDETISLSIYENDLGVILQCMMANSLNWLWSNNNVRLIYDKDLKLMSKELSDVMKCNQGTEFILHYPSLRHIQVASVRDRLEEVFVRDSGIRNMRALLAANFRDNIKIYTGIVDELKSDFEGKRAVIVAAGPSLDNNVELLLNKPEDLIIVSTGTAFRKLLRLGINVDYVIVTDANRRISGQIADIDCSGVPLLYLSTAYRGLVSAYEGKKYIIFQDEYDEAVELADRYNACLYMTGGSVSTTALDVCIRLGCSSIAFIGLDLAYTDNLAHAEGTSRRVANDIQNMPIVEGYSINRTVSGDNSVKDSYQIVKKTVAGSKLFNMYRRWIEKRLKDESNPPVYDASEGGSVIQGMEIITLEEYLG